MAKHFTKTKDQATKGKSVIELVTAIRTNNNILWMSLLEMAFDSDPVKARGIIKSIRKNDKEVTKWLGKL